MDSKHYIIATLPVPKYCIFIFTLRCVVISHVISSTMGGVPDRNFSLPFFFSCMTYKKRRPLKSQTPSLAFSCAVCSSWNVLPKLSASPVNIISVPSAQSSELLSILQTPIQVSFSPAFSEEFITLAQYTTTRCLFMLPDYSGRWNPGVQEGLCSSDLFLLCISED